MSDSWLGADLEEMNGMSIRLWGSAREIDELMTQLTKVIDSVWWKGADADHFRADWLTHVTALQRLTEGFREAGDHIKTQAQDQRRVSQD